MKAKHFFATFAAAAVLVSCSKDREDYADDVCALVNESAELVLNCHTFEDSFEVADKVHAIADELDALEEDAEKHIVELREAALDMTVAETKIYDEQIMNKFKAAKDHLNRAEEHMDKKDSKIDTDYLDYAIKRVKKHIPYIVEMP